MKVGVSSAMAENWEVGISVTLFSSIWTFNLAPTLPFFRRDDFFRKRGGLGLSSRKLCAFGPSPTPTGLTAQSDPSSSSSGRSKAGASSKEISALSLNESMSVGSAVVDSGGLGAVGCSTSLVAGLGLKAEYGLRE